MRSIVRAACPWALALAAALLIPAPGRAGDTVPADLQEPVQVAKKFLEEHTGLKFAGDVKVRRITRAEYQEESAREFREGADDLKEQIRKYWALGLVSDPEKLDRIVRELFSAATTGAYSPKKKELVLIFDPTQLELDMVTLVHELHHCLIDQRYDILKMREKYRQAKDDDGGFALDALLEGTAKLAEEQFRIWRDTKVARPKRADLDQIMQLAVRELAAVYGAGDPDPHQQLVKMDVYFPYTWGMYWCAAQGRENLDRWNAWYARLFLAENMPRSTADVLQSAEGTNPERIAIDRTAIDKWLTGQKRWKLTRAGTSLGEFYIRLWLHQALDNPAAHVANPLGWKGDSLWLFEDGDEAVKRPPSGVLLVTFEFDSHARAVVDQFRKEYATTNPGAVEAVLQRGRLVLFPIGTPGKRLPEELYGLFVKAADGVKLPEPKPNDRALLALLNEYRRTGDANTWRELTAVVKQVPQRTRFVTRLGAATFGNCEPELDREELTVSLHLGRAVAAPALLGALTRAEETALLESALKGVANPATTTASKLNAVRLVWALETRLSADQRNQFLTAVEKHCPRGAEIAAAFRKNQTSVQEKP